MTAKTISTEELKSFKGIDTNDANKTTTDVYSFHKEYKCILTRPEGSRQNTIELNIISDAVLNLALQVDNKYEKNNNNSQIKMISKLNIILQIMHFIIVIIMN